MRIGITILALLLLEVTIIGQEKTPPVQPSESVVISPSASTLITETSPAPIKIPEEELAEVRDRTEINQDAPYNAIIKYVSQLRPEEITLKVKRGVTYENLMNTPEKYRGQLVRAKGVLLYLKPIELRTNPAGIDICYSGMMVNLSTKEYYVFHLIDKPPAPLKNLIDDTSLAEDVEVEGTFLKIAQYELDEPSRLKSGKTFNFAPFIIGRKITRIVYPPPEAAQKFQWIVAMISGVIILGLFIYIIVSGRKDKNTVLYTSSKHKPAPSCPTAVPADRQADKPPDKTIP